MNLLILTPFYPPMVSGAGKYTSDIATGMIERGHSVLVLTAGERPGIVELDGVWVETVPNHFRGSTSLSMLRIARSRHRQRPFDLVISATAFPTGVVGAAVARVLHRPHVVLAHGEDVTVGRVSKMAKRCLPHVFASARRVVANSSFTRGEVIHFGGSPERCVVANPGIDPAPFLAARETERREFRERFGLEGHRVVLTVARLEARKGHDTVLNAVHSLLSEFDDLHYLIVGGGDPAPLREMADRLGMSQRLTIVPYLEDAELPEAYAAADIFAMASRPGRQTEVEGFGIVYLEAAAAGLPCVAGNLGGCSDAVIDGSTGVCVDLQDPLGVAAGLRTLLSSPRMAAKMGSEGRRRVIADGSRTALQARVSPLLSEVVREFFGLAPVAIPTSARAA